MINQHVLAKMVMAACEMKLDKVLEKEAIDIGSLAERYSYNPKALERFLRVLDAYNIISLQNGYVTKGALSDYLEHVRSPHLISSYKLIDNITFSLANNCDAYSQTFGEPFYEHVIQDAHKNEDLRIWGEKSLESWLLPAILNTYDFQSFSFIAEVCGDGYLLLEIMKKQFKPSGALLHPRNNVTDVLKRFENIGLPKPTITSVAEASNLALNDTSIFIYFRTLLGFSDEKVLAEIEALYEKIPVGVKILIIDFYLPDKMHPDYQLSVLADISILTCLGGGLRKREEWLGLLESSSWGGHFSWLDVNQEKTPTILPVFILEATKSNNEI